jgi:hypothetical protein
MYYLPNTTARLRFFFKVSVHNDRHVIILLIRQTDSEYYKRTVNSITNLTNGFRILQTDVIALRNRQTDSEYYKRTINSITNSTNGFRILQTDIIVLQNRQTDSKYYKWTINSIIISTNRFWILQSLQTDSEYSNRTQNNIKWVHSKKIMSEHNQELRNPTHIFRVQHTYSVFNTTILISTQLFWIKGKYSE